VNNLRLVILDYPKLNLGLSEVRKTFGDILATKQVNFDRASNRYISMGPLDMISTHFLIYDQSNIYMPKIVAGIRLCYSDRAKHHNVPLPIEEYISYAPVEYQKKFDKFRKGKSVIVDNNALFVDPHYTYSQTGLKLSEILYFALVQFIVRKGHGHWVGATNERFKASRWGLPTGFAEKNLVFTHPKVPDPHMLLLVEPLNYQWLNECTELYRGVIDNRVEIVPKPYPINETLMSVEEVTEFIKQNDVDESKMAA